MKFIKVETEKGIIHINPIHIIGIGEIAETDEWSIIINRDMAIKISEDEKDHFLMELGSIR